MALTRIPRAPRFGLGALPGGFSMGDPAGPDYGSVYYNGSKLAGKIADASSPTGYYWETVNGQHAPYTPGDEDAFAAAAQAAFQSPEHQNYEYEQSAANASPAMRAVLLNPEWRSYAQFGKPIPPWSQLSSTLQDLIAQVPLLYEQFTNVEQFNADAQAGYAAEVAAKTAPQPLADQRILKDGVVVDGTGKPVPPTDPYYYNAQEDIARQLAAALATGTQTSTPPASMTPAAAGDEPTMTASGGGPAFGGGGGAGGSGPAVEDGGGILSGLSSVPMPVLGAALLAVVVLISRPSRRR